LLAFRHPHSDPVQRIASASGAAMDREEEIPFERLGIPKALRELVVASAPHEDRLALAEGILVDQPSELLGCAYLLAQDPSDEVRAAAAKTLRAMPEDVVASLITQSTPTKMLEFLAVLLNRSPLLDARIVNIRNANDRTITLIAERADAELCERLCYNRDRLLMTPRVYVALHGNRRCRDEHLMKAEAFLRMNNMLPDVPDQRGGGGSSSIEDEVEAALSGQQSIALQELGDGHLQLFDLDATGDDDDLFQGFDFEFSNDMTNFDWDMTEEREGHSPEDELKLEKKIAVMTVGQKIKLAHVGNKTVRALLIKDRNKQVSMAVVKSGRLTDGEVKNLAGNRNINDEVLREVASNREFLRKYPVKVALVNNPKTPPSLGVRLVGSLQKKDLQDLTRNRNVSSVVRQTAIRLFKQKYRSEGSKKK
jgi:hypothetical protein